MACLILLDMVTAYNETFARGIHPEKVKDLQNLADEVHKLTTGDIPFNTIVEKRAASLNLRMLSAYCVNPNWFGEETAVTTLTEPIDLTNVDFYKK
jgi:hypothetical protein